MPLPATLKGAERIACGERCEFEIDAADGSKQTREGVVWNVSEAGVYLVLPADIPEVGTLMRASVWLPASAARRASTIAPARAAASAPFCV